MRVAVVGAGIVGVCSAYELAADGHDVTVFEQRGSAAAEGSFANGGLAAPGQPLLWGTAASPWRMLSRILSRNTPLRLNARLDAGTLAWLWRWWRASQTASMRRNQGRLHRLAAYSRSRQHHLTHGLQLDYERAEGCLVLLRTAKESTRAEPGLGLLNDLGVRFQRVDASRCLAIEPGLNADGPLHSGIHFTHEEVGNCRQFALLLREEAERLGAKFRFHTRVQSLEPGTTPRITRIYTPKEESTWMSAEASRAEGPATDVLPFEPETQSFDAVLVCAAVGSRELLLKHGLRLPLLPVYGYSVTAPLRKLDIHPDIGPRAAVLDAGLGLTISRLGSRLRVAGGAELGGAVQGHKRTMLDTLYKSLHDWFPGAAHMSQAQVWKGARPTLPDGPPLLGASGLPGIWLNLGHGDHGWALACGSARLLADLMAGRPPAIELEGLGLDRLRH